MRNFYETIEKVISFIPEGFEGNELLNELKKIQYDAGYTAPEVIQDRWYDASVALGEHLPAYECLNKEWQKPLIDFWMNKG